MPRLIILACLSSMLVAAAASALPVPDPATSTFSNLDPANAGKDRFIAVVGRNDAGAPDPCNDGRCGDYLVVVRDFQGTPMAGVHLVMDFSACPDIQISCDQLDAQTGQRYEAAKRVAGFTNGLGRFTFKIQGAANSTSAIVPRFLSPGTNAGDPCVRVIADNIEIDRLIPAAYDLDGLGSPSSAAVNSADVSKTKIEALLNGEGQRARSDYNDDARVNAADVGISASLALTSPASGTVQTTPFADGHYCP